MRFSEPATETTPLDVLIENEELNVNVSDRDRMISFMRETLQFVLDQNTDRLDVVIFGILYALKDYHTVEPLSTRDRAKLIGVSSGLISYYSMKYSRRMNICPPKI
jgi:hypothetical protein